ncbi:MAG: T9SS type A sorting domain-containing protein [Bacteroidota bacterium]
MTRFLFTVLAVVLAVPALATDDPPDSTSEDPRTAAFVAEAESQGLSAAAARALGARAENQILRASNIRQGAEFGIALALDGNRAVVGAPFEGDGDLKTLLRGAAYVFEFVGGTWTETAVLRGSNTEAFDEFGVSVALDGDRALVGTIRESGPGNATPGGGAVYVFELSGGAWVETAVLRASNAESSDSFGSAIALDGNRAVIGAGLEDGPNNAIPESGAAYVFDVSEGRWVETAILRASNAGEDDILGQSIALDGDRVLLGVISEAGPFDATSTSGAAYVFERSGETWTETAILRASNAQEQDRFGQSVALDGDRALIGARLEDGPGNATAESGAAYVFEWSGDMWIETAILRARDAGVDDNLGIAVALDGDRALIGASGKAGPIAGTPDAGAAYLFELSDGTWTETVFLRASAPATFDQFGARVALDGDRVLVGAPSQDGPGNAIPNAGAVYAFSATATTIAAEPDEATLALGFPWPNPASGAIRVPYSLAVPDEVRLTAYDLLGREVALLDSGVRRAGEHEAVFNASALPPGMYVVRLVVGTQSAARRVVVVE